MFQEAKYAVDKKQKFHRIASLCVLTLWVVLTFKYDHLVGSLRSLVCYLLPMACIWFPDAMSECQGNLLGRSKYIGKLSNPTFLRWEGWLLLLMIPCLSCLIFYLRS